MLINMVHAVHIVQTPPPKTPLWFSGFENGFPGKSGEWLNYDNGGWTADGKPTEDETGRVSKGSNWAIINQTQAIADGLTPLSGNFVYKSWINHTSDVSHRPYPILHVDPSGKYNPSIIFDKYLSGPAIPIINRFYVWMDWNPSKISNKDWLSFLTIGNNTYWAITGFSLRGPKGELEMAHAPWERTTPTPVIMPRKQWVRFTTYMDYQNNLIYVWMNGQLIFKMTKGGNLNYTDGSNGQTPYLRRVHWGLYANGNFSNATVYNDAIQLWTIPQSITDISKEPLSPYDGLGLN